MPTGKHADGSKNVGGGGKNNAKFTEREMRAMEQENSGSEGRRAAVIAGRGHIAKIIAKGR